MPSPEQLSKRVSPSRWETFRAGKNKQLVQVLEDAAREQAPRSDKEDDHLADDLQGYVTSSKKQPFRVRAKTKQLLLGWIVKGTPAHVIVAKHLLADGRPGYLAFPGRDGRTVFKHSVNHPGTKPNDFLSRAADDAAPAMEDILRQAAEEWFGDIAS